MKKRNQRRVFSVILALVFLFGFCPIRANAGDVGRPKTQINITGCTLTVNQYATVYLNEIFVDGVSTVRYIYSDDISKYESCYGALRNSLTGSGYDAFTGLVPEISGNGDESGLISCDYEDYHGLIAAKNGDITAVADALYEGFQQEGTVSHELYGYDQTFTENANFLIEADFEDAEIIDGEGLPYQIISPIGCTSIVNTDSVTYTVKDGVLIKRVDRTIDYSGEEIRVIYKADYRMSFEWPFTDMKVKPGNWAYEGVRFAYMKGLITGDKSDSYYTTVRPKANISRKEFIQILYRIAGSPDVGGMENPFPDLKLKSDGSKPYYYDAAVWASDSKVVTGKNGMLAGNDPITRQEIAAMMMRFAVWMDLATGVESDITGYPDYNSVSNYAKEAMAWAQGMDIITGREIDGKCYLAPKGNAQRQEVACILQRFYNVYGLDAE